MIALIWLDVTVYGYLLLHLLLDNDALLHAINLYVIHNQYTSNSIQYSLSNNRIIKNYNQDCNDKKNKRKE